jgi:hypothetical protein
MNTIIELINKRMLHSILPFFPSEHRRKIGVAKFFILFPHEIEQAHLAFASLNQLNSQKTILKE